MELTIAEARKARRDLEDKLFDFLSIAIEEFEKDTKLCISAINLTMSDVTCIQDFEFRYKLTSVKVDVQL